MKADTTRIPELDGLDAYVKLCNYVADQEELAMHRKKAAQAADWRKDDVPMIISGVLLLTIFALLGLYLLTKIVH